MEFCEMKNRSEEMFIDIDKLQKKQVKDVTLRQANGQLWAIRHNCKIMVKRYNELLKKYNGFKED